MPVFRNCYAPDGFGAVSALLAERFSPGAHGNMPRWLDALAALPVLRPTRVQLGDTVTVDGVVDAAQQARLERSLEALHPWRKGPFSLFGLHIDTEWRSDWKWRRVAPGLQPLNGHRVLDVGSGNGYFGWRMLEAGAAEVVGVDPTLVYCLQHQAVNTYLRSFSNHVLPLRFEELPALEFDTVFSMGVVYHRRDPHDHVQRLFRHTRPGGQVVLESLVVTGSEPLLPPGRYARMRNVHVVPTTAQMAHWLEHAGFTDLRLVDVSATTVAEQRPTGWMRFQSLPSALDPARPALTVEGHPAPVRAVVVGRKPV